MTPLLKLIFAGNEENPTDLPCLQAFCFKRLVFKQNRLINMLRKIPLAIKKSKAEYTYKQSTCLSWYNLVSSDTIYIQQYLCRNNTFAKDKYLLVVDSPGSDTLAHTRTGTVEKRLSFCFIEHYNVTQPTIYVVQVM